MTTIRDVAEYAHVSVATVSRVLKKNGPVSPETEARVYEAIEKLGYLPPHSGKKSNENKKLSVLVLFPNSIRSMHSEMLSGIRDAAKEEGILLYYAVCDNDVQLEESYVNELRRGMFDGLVFMGTFLQVNDLLQLKKTCQIALCGEYVEGAKVLSVTVDYEQAAYDAVSHLISLGHKKIAIITTHQRVWSSVQKENGYRKALLDHGLPVEDEYLFYGRFTSNNSRYILNYFESMDEPPTAYFCISDDIARSICNCLMERNYEIGNELSVCGFDDSESSTSAYPRLTTVNQPFYDIGFKVIGLLKNNMTSVLEHNEMCYLPHKLYIRESTSQKEV
ncbi:MAG: LacI family DNA-binding transcriptional regulator [Clostridiales bacterium]|nr:LacI family DNA-binding transcriptional regulator [Clostridiales bacterium]